MRLWPRRKDPVQEARDSAYAQGSDHSLYSGTVSAAQYHPDERAARMLLVDPDYAVLRHTTVLHAFPDWEALRESHPVLSLALKGKGAPAQNVKVEWLKDTQIMRFPGGVREGESEEKVKDELFGKLLDTMENVLIHGRRDFDTTSYAPRGYCGGVLDLLGRMPVIGDRISIRFLRERELVERRTEYMSGRVIVEYLTEFTLEAK
jgi:hypothetical protein